MKLLTESQVAELYGITKPCLRRWRHERRALPFVKVGRLARYRQEDVEAFVSANLQTVGGKAEVPKAAEAMA
jgi:excisionase family DNA binding protein